jgi:hypothetical protein
MRHSSKPQIRDQQTYPFVMLPKAFFTRIKPSLNALAAYTAIKFYARNDRSAGTSIPDMARTVNLSIDSFRRGVVELVKKKALKVRRQTHKTAGGKRMNLPNVYEILDLHPDKESI